jgi:hypothetical protein
MRSVITILSMLCAVTLIRGQAVPSQIADIQVGDNGGTRFSNNLQLRYNVDGRGVNQSQVAYIQFNLTVFPANLTPAQIQKATLVLWVENGGNPGTVSVCQVSSAWFADTITGANAPSCTNTTMYSFSVSAAQLQQGSFVEVDITPMVQSWYNGTPNYGILLAPETSAAVAGNSGVNIQFDCLEINGGYPPMLDLVLQNQGTQGVQGPTGPQGPAGLTGLTGAMGPQGPAGPAGGLLLSNTITLTNAQVLALQTVPQILVPAPASNVVIFPERIMIEQQNAYYSTPSQEFYIAVGPSINSSTIAGEFGPWSSPGYAVFLDSYFFSGTIVGQSSQFAGQQVIGYVMDTMAELGGTGGNVTITTYYVTYTVQ